jgi:hypothetical protein
MPANKAVNIGVQAVKEVIPNARLLPFVERESFQQIGFR